MINKESLQYAMSFLGTPYKWGGANPISGVDCSGFVQEVLTSCGIDIQGDQNAQAYYNHFSIHGALNVFGAGALAFYGKDEKSITHITLFINDWQTIGANGGGSHVIDKSFADKNDAFVKIRPFDYRKDLVAVYMPIYGEKGSS